MLCYLTLHIVQNYHPATIVFLEPLRRWVTKKLLDEDYAKSGLNLTAHSTKNLIHWGWRMAYCRTLEITRYTCILKLVYNLCLLYLMYLFSSKMLYQSLFVHLVLHLKISFQQLFCALRPSNSLKIKQIKPSDQKKMQHWTNWLLYRHFKSIYYTLP